MGEPGPSVYYDQWSPFANSRVTDNFVPRLVSFAVYRERNSACGHVHDGGIPIQVWFK